MPIAPRWIPIFSASCDDVILTPNRLDPMTSEAKHWVLTLVCDDQPGIVHAISGAVVAAAGNITESQQFSSEDTGRFFIRLQIESNV